MRRIFLLAFVVCLFLVPSKAHADTIFSLHGTLQDGLGRFNGTVVYLTRYNSFGQVTGKITDGGFSFTVPPDYLGETVNEGAVTHVDVFSVGANYDLSLYIPNSILAGGAGGSLCALSTPCAGFNASNFGDYDLSGNSIFGRQSFQTLTATTQVTPEPGSFILLCTGTVAMAGSMRRRFVRQADAADRFKGRFRIRALPVV